jgi:hypothetical protein
MRYFYASRELEKGQRYDIGTRLAARFIVIVTMSPTSTSLEMTKNRAFDIIVPRDD